MTDDEPSSIPSSPLDKIASAERAAFLDAGLRRTMPSCGVASRGLLAAHSRRRKLPGSPAADLGATDRLEPTRRPTVDRPSRVEVPARSSARTSCSSRSARGAWARSTWPSRPQPVRRTVALKLIKAGMDSRQVLARFEAERQALALMDHPNIAKVFDAGTTDAGRPYFVMELVKGIPITQFCDERRLTTRERLELAIPVCQAVQHAHQKGIIHRDLKPSNVLVALYDGKPVPKVIDFGVAKATGPRLTDQTLYTEFGAVVGTLEYMSPEQAELNQLDIDTRSDIYSLGVLLYELLTGSTPLDRKRLKQGAILEMLRVIREEESPRPSMRLSHDRGAAVDRGVPQHRAAEAERAGAGRARLDRDEGAGEGPQPAVRDGQRPGGRPAALPGRRAGAGVPAVGCVIGCGKFARRNQAALLTASLGGRRHCSSGPWSAPGRRSGPRGPNRRLASPRRHIRRGRNRAVLLQHQAEARPVDAPRGRQDGRRRLRRRGCSGSSTSSLGNGSSCSGS